MFLSGTRRKETGMSEPANGFEFLEWLRTKNGNLEIAITPYEDVANQL